ncbi:MAG TPA: UDP-N-acetylmuramoyl-L-alanyl-D-glutamate--2,6-diaminopimelate ligase [Rhodanobacteraceae bacterium]|nr:UDP-N-acetylmuramoyl-L-alanyl-D-glutamate--2,6-diaminopimelate ligase [Rhodanobacteraceae bacterium]
MALGDLLHGLADAGPVAALEIGGLNLDSRAVGAGDAFVALRGGRFDGLDFAPAALERGAAAVLADAPARPVPAAVRPLLWVDDLAERLGEIAARFFGQPGTSLDLVGVTGTNGKTSIVQLLAQALSGLGRRAASIGTLGAGLHGALERGERTTPDAIQVQALLARFRDAGAGAVAMEVSSHALVQGRVNGVPFDVAIFTNLSRDHLDYHGSMQAYGEAKARLFAWPGLRAAVINAGDAFGRELLARLPARVQRLAYGVGRDDAEVAALDLQRHADGSDFTLRTPWGSAPIHSPLLGRFNVENLLAVAACLGALGVGFAPLCRALAAATPVTGRMQRLGGGGQPLVVVDYAHTPDALEQALATLREHTRGRLTVVFGAGGDRDSGKRAPMGAAAEAGADVLIVTDDNPRGEDGDAIVAGILGGLAQPARARVIRAREDAIATAIAEAGTGDAVLIAGKGHETYQEAAGVRRPFDDAAVARAALEARPC